MAIGKLALPFACRPRITPVSPELFTPNYSSFVLRIAMYERLVRQLRPVLILNQVVCKFACDCHCRQEAQLTQRDRASTLSRLKSCKMLHGWSRNLIWKALQQLNDLQVIQGHWRRSHLIGHIWCSAVISRPIILEYTLWTEKMWQYIWHYNSGKTRSIFIIFCTAVSRKKRFTHLWKICPPHLNNVLTLPCES